MSENESSINKKISLADIEAMGLEIIEMLARKRFSFAASIALVEHLKMAILVNKIKSELRT